MCLSNRERIEAIIDQACKENTDGKRWSPETVGYLAMWVLQLQDDLEAEKLKGDAKEWWEQMDKDTAYHKVLTGE